MIDHKGLCLGQPCTCGAADYVLPETLPAGIVLPEFGVTPPSTYDVGLGIAADVLGRSVTKSPERWRDHSDEDHMVYRCTACRGRMFPTLSGDLFHRVNGERYCPTGTEESAPPEDLDAYEESWE
jgi:hypothetical protein